MIVDTKYVLALQFTRVVILNKKIGFVNSGKKKLRHYDIGIVVIGFTRFTPSRCLSPSEKYLQEISGQFIITTIYNFVQQI